MYSSTVITQGADQSARQSYVVVNNLG